MYKIIEIFTLKSLNMFYGILNDFFGLGEKSVELRYLLVIKVEFKNGLHSRFCTVMSPSSPCVSCMMQWKGRSCSVWRLP